MTGCAADYCTNSSTKGHRMCKFPRDSERRNKWIKKVERDDWIPGLSAALCYAHFTADMWEKSSNGKLILKTTAIPIIFPKRTCVPEEVSNPSHNYQIEGDTLKQSKPCDIVCQYDEVAKKLIVIKDSVNKDKENPNIANTKEESITNCIGCAYVEASPYKAVDSSIALSNSKQQQIRDSDVTNNCDSCKNMRQDLTQIQARLSKLEKMFDISYKSRIKMKRDLKAAREIYRRLKKQVSSCSLKKSLSSILNENQISDLSN